ncbi:MAG: hypothetical protein NVSMB14_08720 [Isosphaeraceae bacterium]
MSASPKQAQSAKMAIIYITIGALIDVWTAVFYAYDQKRGMSETAHFFCAGFFFTGLVLICIGLLVGKIGRAARMSEVTAPPPVQMMAPTAGAPAQVPVNAVTTTAPTAPGYLPADMPEA